MSKREVDPAYYAVVTADVRYDSRLRPNAKLLYGELTALCNKYGHCWAGNDYFAELYNLSAGTISHLISQLEKYGYIRCEMVATETGSERRIYAGMFLVQRSGGLYENDNTPLVKKRKGGLDENDKPINKYNNTQLITPYSPPEGDGAPKAKKSRRQPKAQPNWKPERFSRFWAFYPRGENKQAAIRAWDKLQPSDELIDNMAASLKKQMQRKDWKEGIGIPYASTWINGRRWEDEDKTSTSSLVPAPAQPLRGEGVRYL